MIDFLSKWANTYEERKVARDMLPNGLEVSTCWTPDYGFETAIIDDNGIHPVGRYETMKIAESAHKKWIGFAKNGVGKKVTKLAVLGETKEIVLKIQESSKIETSS